MIHFDRYPLDVRKAIVDFTPAAKRWMVAAGVNIDDVLQEITLAVLAGLDITAAVPAALGLRKLSGGEWWPDDAVCMAGSFDFERHDDENDGDAPIDDDQTPPTPPRHDADGIEKIMSRDGVGRRAAQIRVKKQWDALQRQRDLFVDEVAA